MGSLIFGRASAPIAQAVGVWWRRPWLFLQPNSASAFSLTIDACERLVMPVAYRACEVLPTPSGGDGYVNGGE